MPTSDRPTHAQVVNHHRRPASAEQAAATDNDQAHCGCDTSLLAEARAPTVEFRDDLLEPVQRSVRAAAFRLLLESGQPVELARVAAEAEVDPMLANEVIGWFEERGSARRHRDGRIEGIAGLSTEPTRHRVELKVGTRWTWCALDAVGIVGAVGDGLILSETNRAGLMLEVRDGKVEPTDVAVFIADGYGMTSTMEEWCPLVNFFTTMKEAEAWAAECGAAGRVVRVDEVAPEAIERWRSVLTYQ